MVLVLRKLRQDILGCGLMESLVELVLVDLEQSAASRGQVEAQRGEVLLPSDGLRASLST